MNDYVKQIPQLPIHVIKRAWRVIPTILKNDWKIEHFINPTIIKGPDDPSDVLTYYLKGPDLWRCQYMWMENALYQHNFSLFVRMPDDNNKFGATIEIATRENDPRQVDDIKSHIYKHFISLYNYSKSRGHIGSELGGLLEL